MPDAAAIAAFLTRYTAECDDAGIDPLPVPELAELLRLVAEVDPPQLDS